MSERLVGLLGLGVRSGQVVIGGETAAVERAIRAFEAKGYPAQRLAVSHAFHTKIVAPAAAPLPRA